MLLMMKKVLQSTRRFLRGALVRVSGRAKPPAGSAGLSLALHLLPALPPAAAPLTHYSYNPCNVLTPTPTPTLGLTLALTLTLTLALTLTLQVTMTPHAVGLDEDLEASAKEVTEEMKAKQQALMSALGDIEQYAIDSTEGDWDAALGGKAVKTGMVSVKGKKTPVKGGDEQQPSTPKTDSKKRKESKDGSKSSSKSSSKKAKTPKKD